jgi:hypothetical protein
VNSFFKNAIFSLFDLSNNKISHRVIRTGVVMAFSWMGALAPVQAQPITVTGRPLTFRGLEFDYSGADRMNAAKTAIHRAIPSGSNVGDARKFLTGAGAICRNHSAKMTCVSNGFDVVENTLHDVAWTIDVDHKGGAVTDVSIDRESIGS